jgi:ATP-dependent RNA/DNA helicase IGHMBP2
MDYFKKQLELLRLEKMEDLVMFNKVAESTSIADRRTDGLSWYPVAIRGTELGRGDYLTVELERTTHQEIAHQFRSGMPAALFSNYNAREDRVEGVVAHQSGNKLKLALRTDELPRWAREGKLGVDLLFDDTSYDEMEAALSAAASLEAVPEEGRLTRILVGGESPTFRKVSQPARVPGLNPSQQAAVQLILAAQNLALVHGPPGTGKTTTLVQAIKALTEQESGPLLVVAPSNAAVDLLSEKLSDVGLRVLRIGNPARVSEHLVSLTLDHQLAEHSTMKSIRRLKKQANELKNMAHTYKRNFGKAERDQRKALFDEAHKIQKEVNKLEEYGIEDIIGNTQVVTATLVGCNQYAVRSLTYSAVIIDEAGQALEPACWIPALKSQKLIMAGDYFQLPPTIKSEQAAQEGLAQTLLEKCVGYHPEAVVLLEEQYRMHEQIMGYSARVFYESRLRAHASVAGHLLFPADVPLLFIDTAGCGFDEQAAGTSYTNPEEAAFLLGHLTRFLEELTHSPLVQPLPTVGVISPYKQQVYLMQELQRHSAALMHYGDALSVNTIDSFQGQERDIIYISLTRSNSEGGIGFLSDIRRMNVAMTRARKKLVVIGDSATLAPFPFYGDFIAYAEALGAYHSAWEFMDS